MYSLFICDKILTKCFKMELFGKLCYMGMYRNAKQIFKNTYNLKCFETLVRFSLIKIVFTP